MPQVYLEDDELVAMILDRPEVVVKAFAELRRQLDGAEESASLAWTALNKERGKPTRTERNSDAQ